MLTETDSPQFSGNVLHRGPKSNLAGKQLLPLANKKNGKKVVPEPQSTAKSYLLG